MKRKILMLLMTFTMSAAMLAGCSKDDTTKDDVVTEGTKKTEADDATSEDTASAEKTLGDYLAEPDVKKQMDADMESAKTTYASTYSDISYEADGNTFVYIYVYKDPVSIDDATYKTLDEQLASAVKDQNLISLIEQQSGVDGISIRYIYRNPDGTEVFNETYTE